jgi:hypothetical protein
MPKRPISDDLLRLSVETKIEAGTDPAKIRELIEAFSSYGEEDTQNLEIVGFLEIEDVPPGRRETFLKALLLMAEDSDHRSRNLRQKTARHITSGMTFPTLLLGKAKAMLRLRPVT